MPIGRLTTRNGSHGHISVVMTIFAQRKRIVHVPQAKLCAEVLGFRVMDDDCTGGLFGIDLPIFG